MRPRSTHIRTIPGGNATGRGLLTPKTVPLWAEGRYLGDGLDLVVENELLGGSLQAGPRPGGGFSVRAWLPAVP